MRVEAAGDEGARGVAASPVCQLVAFPTRKLGHAFLRVAATVEEHLAASTAYSHHVVSGTLAVHSLSALGDIVDLSVDGDENGELRVAAVVLLKLLEGVHLLGRRERRSAVRLFGVVLNRGALAKVQSAGEEVRQQRQEDKQRQQAGEERLAIVLLLLTN